MEDSCLYFDVYKNSLQINYAEKNTNEKDLRPLGKTILDPIGEISKMEIHLDDTSDYSKKSKLIIFYEVMDTKFEIVLKRFIIKFGNDIMKEDPLENYEIKNFIGSSLKEFIISKLVDIHPAAVRPLGFEVTFILSKNLLITEFLMEHGGDVLSKNLNLIKYNEKRFLSLFSQSASILSLFQKLKIAYNDIKMDNFLIDKKGNLRIIDYDISEICNIRQEEMAESEFITALGTIGYFSPEKGTNINISGDKDKPGRAMKEKRKINPWKADIYALGVFGLQLLGILGINKNDILEIQNVVTNIDSHEKFYLQKISQIYFENNPDLTEKIQLLFRNILDYSPYNRISFITLSKLLNSIDKIKVNDLIDEIMKDLLEDENKIEQMTKSEIYKKYSDLTNETYVEHLKQNIRNTNKLLELEIECYQNERFIDYEKLSSELKVKTEFYKKESIASEKQIYVNQKKLEEELVIFQYSKILTENLKSNIITEIDKAISFLNEQLEKNVSLDFSTDLPIIDKKQIEFDLDNSQSNTSHKADYQKELISKPGPDKIKNGEKMQPLNKEVIVGKSIQKKESNNNIQKNPPFILERGSNLINDSKQKETKKDINKNNAQQVPDKNENTANFDFLNKLEEKNQKNQKTQKINKLEKHICPLCSKEQNYEGMLQCISKKKEIRNNILEIINIRNDSKICVWNLWNAGLSKKEISHIIRLFMVCDKVEYLDFGNNPAFDDDCFDFLCETLSKKPNYKGIMLYKTNISPKNRLRMIDLFSKSENFEFYAFDKEGLQISDVKSLADNALLLTNILPTSIWSHLQFIKVLNLNSGSILNSYKENCYENIFILIPKRKQK